MSPKKNNAALLGLIAGIFILFLLFGLGIFVLNQPTPCNTGDSNYMDLLKARNFAAGVFESGQWNNSYSVLPYRVNVVWDSPELSALVSLEYLIFNCGYVQADLDEYFSDQNFYQLMFIDYENPQKMKTCQANDLRLYEFRAQFNGEDYLLSQWAKPDGNKRVFSFLMVFPESEASLMGAYAEKIFPELPACP
ncbi:MAG: hypothetical protein RBS68_04285 [Anaerolineales bacterium]|nr:hypothetical protein [Anaerolineales bacterium]